MMLYDAHNHLQLPELAGCLDDLRQLVEQAQIGGMIVNGTCEGDWDNVATIAKRFPFVVPSYGLHPWMVNERSPAWRERLGPFWDAGGFVGEIGLDRWKETGNFEDQVDVFRWQFREAARRNLPASVHCLRAWGALTNCLEDLPIPDRGFLVHAFGGSAEIARELLKFGAYFSFSGSFLDPRKASKQAVFREIPLDRILVETDAPSMPLPPELDRFPDLRESREEPINHPGNLPVAYRGLASVVGRPFDEVVQAVAANYQRFFFSRDA